MLSEAQKSMLFAKLDVIADTEAMRGAIWELAKATAFNRLDLGIIILCPASLRAGQYASLVPLAIMQAIIWAEMREIMS